MSGTFKEALKDPDASPFLCPPDNTGNVSCFSDFSGQGICQSPRAYGKEDYDVTFIDVVRASSRRANSIDVMLPWMLPCVSRN